MRMEESNEQMSYEFVIKQFRQAAQAELRLSERAATYRTGTRNPLEETLGSMQTPQNQASSKPTIRSSRQSNAQMSFGLK